MKFRYLLLLLLFVSSLATAAPWHNSGARLLAHVLLPDLVAVDVPPGSPDERFLKAADLARRGNTATAVGLIDALFAESGQTPEYAYICLTLRTDIVYVGNLSTLDRHWPEVAFRRLKQRRIDADLLNRYSALAFQAQKEDMIPANTIWYAIRPPLFLQFARFGPRILASFSSVPAPALNLFEPHDRPLVSTLLKAYQFQDSDPTPFQERLKRAQASHTPITPDTSGTRSALDTAYRQATEGRHFALAFETALLNGDLEICPQADMQTFCLDPASGVAGFVFAAHTHWPPTIDNLAAQALDRARRKYQEAEAALAQGAISDRAYELGLRKAYLALLSGDEAAARRLYAEAAGQAEAGGYGRDAAWLNAILAIESWDGARLEAAFSADLARGDLEGAARIASLVEQSASASYARGDPFSSIEVLRFGAIALENAGWPAGGARLRALEATAAQQLGRVDISAAEIERVVAADVALLKETRGADLPADRLPSAIGPGFPEFDLENETAYHAAGMLRELVTVIERLALNEASRSWLKRLDSVEARFAALAEEYPRQFRDRLEEAKQQIAQGRARVEFAILQGEFEDCSVTASNLTRLDSAATAAADQALSFQIELAQARCSPESARRLRARLKEMAPLHALAASYEKWRNDGPDTPVVANAMVVSAGLQTLRALPDYRLLDDWTVELRKIAQDELARNQKNPRFSNAPLAEQPQILASGLATLADLYSSISLAGQGRREQAAAILLRMQADKNLVWPATDPVTLYWEASIEAAVANGNAAGAFFFLNTLWWIEDNAQWQRAGFLPAAPQTARLAVQERDAVINSAGVASNILDTSENSVLAGGLPTGTAPTPQHVGDLVRALPPHSTLLAYHFTGDRILLLRADAGVPQAKYLSASPDNVRRAAADLRLRLASRISGWQTPGARLYNWLIAESGPIPEGNLVVLAGTPQAGAIPWEAIGPSPDRLLGATNPLLYVRTLADGRAPSWVRQGPSLAVGYDGLSLQHAEEEASAVAGRLGGKLLAGPAATSENVLGSFAGARRIHVAAHAGFDPANPFRSGLDLADGDLPVWQLLGAPSKPELIVFSGCNTKHGLPPGVLAAGLGPEAADIAGLAVAAGAGMAVGDLWRADDRTTSSIVSAFYQALAAGKDYVSALHDARKPYFAPPTDGATPPHPFLYAGWVIWASDLKAASADPFHFDAGTAAPPFTAPPVIRRRTEPPSSALPTSRPPAPIGSNTAAFLVRSSSAALVTDPALALALAIYAQHAGASPQSEAAMRAAWRALKGEPAIPFEGLFMRPLPDPGRFSPLVPSALFRHQGHVLQLFDPQSMASLGSFSIAPDFAITPDGKRVVDHAEAEGMVSVRDGANGSILRRQALPISSTDLETSVDPSRFYNLDDERHELRIWNLDSLTPLAPFRFATNFPVARIAVSPHGKFLIAATPRDGRSLGTARVWDLADSAHPRDLGYSIPGIRWDSLTPVSFSADDRVILLTRAENPSRSGSASSALLIECATGKQLFRYPDPAEASAQALGLTPDGKFAIVARPEPEPKASQQLLASNHEPFEISMGLVQVVSVADGKIAGTLARQTVYYPLQLSFTSDQKLLRVGQVIEIPVASQKLPADHWRASTEPFALEDLLLAARSAIRPLTSAECTRYFDSPVCPDVP